MTEAAPENPSAGPATPAEDGTQAPPWASEADFSPEKAWSLIQNLRADNRWLVSRHEKNLREIAKYESRLREVEGRTVQLSPSARKV